MARTRRRRGPERLTRAGLLGARLCWIACGGFLFSEQSASGQERPDESELFGEEESASDDADGSADGQDRGDGQDGEDDQATDSFMSSIAPPDPLEIGGVLYQRIQAVSFLGESLGKFRFAAPTLLDLYLDANPNDRVRAYAQIRTVFDSTLPDSQSEDLVVGSTGTSGGVAGTQDLSDLTSQGTRDVQIAVDQMWLRFDLARRLFATVGTQHVRWGQGRFWTPGDLLHLRRRSPTDVFDARTGRAMIKLHVPVESLAWNFYGYLLLEDDDAVQRLDSVAGAVRGEFVLGTAELALSGIFRRGRSARLVADLSFGLGDVDVYGELALRDAGEIDRVSVSDTAEAEAPGATVDQLYPVYRETGLRSQVVGGITYTGKYHGNDTWTLGAEYFYNPLGYDNSDAYPGLVLPHDRALSDAATFFYLGQAYAGGFLSFPGPMTLDDHTFALTTLGNLTDKSFITRLDYYLTVLTHLRLEAFAAVRYGERHGEFLFEIPDIPFGSMVVNRKANRFDFGLALRVNI